MITVYSIDLEFPGPCPKQNGTNSLGITVYDTETDEVLARLLMHVRMGEDQVWNAETVKEFWEKPAPKGAGPFYDEVKTAQLDPATPTREQAGQRVVGWIRNCDLAYEKRGKRALLFDTGGSDFSQLEALMPAGTALKMIFGKFVPTICTTSFMLGVARATPEQALNKSAAEELVLKALGLERPVFNISHDHNPMNDAEYNARFYGFLVRELAQPKPSAEELSNVGTRIDQRMCRLDGPADFYLLAVDVEASGRNHREHFMPRFGAKVIRQSDRLVMAKFESYVAQPAGRTWEQRSLRQFWLVEKNREHYYETLMALANGPPSGDEAMRAFITWSRCIADGVGKDRIVAVTDTAGFDIGWLDAYMPDGLSMLYLFGDYKPIRDVSSFYAGVAHCTPQTSLWGGAKRAYEAVSLATNTIEPLKHTPAEDAGAIGINAAALFQHLEEQNRAKLARIADGAVKADEDA